MTEHKSYRLKKKNLRNQQIRIKKKLFKDYKQ